MRMTAAVRWRLRVLNLVVALLFVAVIGALAWLSQQFTLQADWTAGNRNTLGTASISLLQRMPDPLQITSYASESASLRNAIEHVIGRYRRYKKDIRLSFVTPDSAPQQVRDLGIERDGELYLEYRGRGKTVAVLNEQNISNALAALMRERQRTIQFLTGHGERLAQGRANHDLGLFGQELTRSGVEIAEFNSLTGEQALDTDAVVAIASPQLALLPGEVEQLRAHLANGGNLLWLWEPTVEDGLQELARALDLQRIPGMVVDQATERLGIADPRFIPIVDFGLHAISVDLQNVVLLPLAAGIEVQSLEHWSVQALLTSSPQSWSEQSSGTQRQKFTAGPQERSGPLTLGVALTREHAATAREQRIVVIGDGDFLSNTYLGNGANLRLGLNIVNWLLADETLLDIRIEAAPDRELNLSKTAIIALSMMYLVGLPGLLFVTGWLIWWRRRSR